MKNLNSAKETEFQENYPVLVSNVAGFRSWKRMIIFGQNQR